jgi:hypothetical protein
VFACQFFSIENRGRLFNLRILLNQVKPVRCCEPREEPRLVTFLMLVQRTKLAFPISEFGLCLCGFPIQTL